MTLFAPSYGQESASLHVSERARNHRSLPRPCNLCLQRSRRLLLSQVTGRPGAGARGREGALSACTPGPRNKDHRRPPPHTPGLPRAETRRCPREAKPPKQTLGLPALSGIFISLK